jgi:signal transduction histidine kinase
MEAELRRMESLAMVGGLAAEVAHDVANMAQVIELSAELLEGMLGRDDERRALAEEIRAAARVAAELNARLARIGVPQDEHAEGVCDAAAEVRAVVRMLERSHRHAARLVAVVEERPLLVPLSSSTLTRVVVNLITNAVDALAAGGTVQVLIAARDATAALEVADDGPGMSADVVARIFEPYFTTKRTGTGLGLPSCRAIVERAGGAIEVDSAPGRGTRVRIALPLVLPT